MGGSALADDLAMLNPGGRLVIIGTLGGGSGELPIGQLMAKRARVIGSTLRARPVENKASLLEATRYLVWPQLASGAIQLPIHARLPPEQAADAHTILREGGHIGMVLLELAPPSGDHRRGRRRNARYRERSRNGERGESDLSDSPRSRSLDTPTHHAGRTSVRIGHRGLVRPDRPPAEELPCPVPPTISPPSTASPR